MEEQINNLPPAEEAPPVIEPEKPVEAKVEEPAPSEKTVDEPPDATALQAEVERLKEIKRKAEEDAAYWRKQKAEARADYFRDREKGAQPEPPAEPVPGTAPEPKPSDFTDYDEYVKSITDWRVKQARAQWEMDALRRQQQQEMMERQQLLQEKLKEGYQKYTDFEEVAFDRTASHITPMIVDILADCDHPADVAYYLAKNRVEGVAISRMTPVKAARAIAQLETKLASSSPSSAQRKTTNAPPPIKPLSGGASVKKDPDKMTPSEFAEWRRSMGARPY